MRTLTPSAEIVERALRDAERITQEPRCLPTKHTMWPMEKKFCDAMAIATAAGWEMLGNGQGRRTFDTGDGYVLKIPRGHGGEIQNEAEAREYANPDKLKGWPLAEAELVDFNGVIALRMEAVTPAKEGLPAVDWEGVTAKGGKTPYDAHRQTGVAKRDGRPVVYDYAHDVLYQ